MEILGPALRQYRHNNSDDFVFGYDVVETEKIIATLQEKIKTQQKTIGSYAKRCEDLKKAYWLAKNAAAGLTNYCEESASTRKCEKELEKSEMIYRDTVEE